jgi:GrpB-like predicted nucleotidyltransferase (UPF0157 family)
MLTDSGPEFVMPRVVHGAPVLLAAPDPTWGVQFDDVEARIRAALGARALVLEHVGSTAVPGLVAKPVIDVVVELPDPTDEDTYVPYLEAAGFALAHREPAWHQHRLLRGSEPAANLHVFGPGCEETQRLLAFRDWLRTHPDDRELYAETKRDLATREWEYVQDYADAKSVVVEAILARAYGDRS